MLQQPASLSEELDPITTVPKAFISHTSTDKDHWARPLAQKLRFLGIDAWFDEWEIQAGDSIVQKIFKSGIEETDAFVVILSKDSITKPWVNAELDVAVVRNVEKLMRLIPIKVDDCEVPTALSAKRYLSIEQYGTIDAIAHEIADALHGGSKAPPIGSAPSYVSKASLQLPRIGPKEELVLETLYDLNLDSQGIFLRVDQVVETLNGKLTERQIQESLEVLSSEHYLDGRHKHRGIHDVVDFYPHTVLILAGANGLNVDDLWCAFVSAILNSPNHQLGLDEYVETSGFPRLHIWALVKELKGKDLVIHVQPMGPTLGRAILKNEVLLRRWTTENCP